MQPAQQEKLKDLIQKSSILNGQERSEWLTLLELMDDKQLSELEKILEGAGPRPGVANRPDAAAVGSEIEESGKLRQLPDMHLQPKPAQQYKPSFKHIMNMPNVPPKPKPAPAISQPQPSKPFPQSDADLRKKGFAQRLKDIFAEKELKAGHPEPEEELELPAPGQKASPVQKKTPQTFSGTEPEQPRHPIFVEKSQPEVEKPKPEVPKPPIKQPETKPASGVTAKSDISGYESPSLKLKHEQEVAAGINFPKVTKESKSKILSSIKPAKEKPVAKELELKEIKDAGTLTATILKREDFNSLVKKMRSLVSKFGYNNVLTSLESSPLHKVYLQTGTKLLNDQMSFEQLADQKPAGGLQAKEYLERKEFEVYADLLRQIQAG